MKKTDREKKREGISMKKTDREKKRRDVTEGERIAERLLSWTKKLLGPKFAQCFERDLTHALIWLARRLPGRVMAIPWKRIKKNALLEKEAIEDLVALSANQSNSNPVVRR